MKVIHLVMTELIGMFIDDGDVALLAVGLIGIVSPLVLLLGLPALLGGLLLLAGCIAILALTVQRARGALPLPSLCLSNVAPS